MPNSNTKGTEVWSIKVAGKPVMTKADQSEFARLYHQYVTRIYRYLYARVGSKDAAEDLTAQVFLAALQRYPKLNTRENNLPAWLFTIARNKMVDAYRRERRNVPLEYAADYINATPDPLAGIVAQENAAELKHILFRLPDNQRELLELRFAGELSYREIGKIIGKSEGSVKMAVHRLIRKLQEEMENDHV